MKRVLTDGVLRSRHNLPLEVDLNELRDAHVASRVARGVRPDRTGESEQL